MTFSTYVNWPKHYDPQSGARVHILQDCDHSRQDIWPQTICNWVPKRFTICRDLRLSYWHDERERHIGQHCEQIPWTAATMCRPQVQPIPWCRWLTRHWNNIIFSVANHWPGATSSQPLGSLPLEHAFLWACSLLKSYLASPISAVWWWIVTTRG